jgi:ATP-dependent helicase/nuclease subunit A
VSERAAAAAAAVPAPAPAPHPPAVDAISARAGTAIHLLLQWLSEDHSRSLATLTRRLAAELKSAVEPEECAAWLAEAQAVIEAPALAGLFNPAHLQRAWNEVPVSWTVDGVCHQGVIDRLVDDGAQLWIIDYKTTSIVNRDTLQQLHAPQLQGYAQAIEQLFCGRPYRAGLILTAHREWLELGQGG